MLRALSDHELARCRYPTTGAAASPMRQLNARQARIDGKRTDALTIAAILLCVAGCILTLALIAGATQQHIL